VKHARRDLGLGKLYFSGSGGRLISNSKAGGRVLMVRTAVIAILQYQLNVVRS
jgi:hypothetical protein